MVEEIAADASACIETIHSLEDGKATKEAAELEVE
jgi:hypothetical protein